jgi:hypothetical protein
MTDNKLEYPLQNGFIANWLVAEPLLKNPPPNFDPNLMSNLEFQSVDLFSQEGIFSEQLPKESTKTVIEQIELFWNYYRCQDDCQISVTAECSHWQILTGWAFAQLTFPETTTATLNLFSDNFMEVWVNGKSIYSSVPSFDRMNPKAVQVSFEKNNQIYVRFSKLSVGNDYCRFAMQLNDLPSEEHAQKIIVALPTIARFPHRFQIFERLFENAYLEDIVQYHGDHFYMRWMEDTRDTTYFTWEIQDKKGAYYVQGNAQPDPAKPKDVGHGFRLYERPFWLALRPTGREFFEQNIRYTKRLPIHILDNKYSETLYGSPYERRQEALIDAAKHGNNLFAALACMELGRWDDLLPETVVNAIEQVSRQERDSERLLLGLLVMLYRFANNPNFPQQWIEPIQNAILSFGYQETDGAFNAIDYKRESSQLIIIACELLAGQRFPDERFKASEAFGSKHFEQAIASLGDWLSRRGQYGLEDWNSNSDLGFLILALSQTATHADNEHIAELAAVFLDKLIFLLAINTYHGAYGSSHGRISATMLKSAQLEASSGITRLLWGTGVYNHHIEGVTGLALSNYEFPTFFKEIATSNLEEFLTKERHISPAGVEANIVTYKTPDFMLSSVQDFQPGMKGTHQHVWQATFGTEAVVFVTHPACSSEEPSFQPGFWAGNHVLPRTAQWKDVLISLHHLPDDDWMGYTHAYFPLPAFDDFFFSDRWMYLRKGGGYLAITASKGTQFIRQGNNAYRELRSYGLKNIWVCQLGREAIDGSFDKFRNKVNALPLEFGNLSVKFTNLREDSISFGWQEPLLVNGLEQSLHWDKHLENPFCSVAMPAKEIDIQYEEILMRLNFE